MNTFEEDSLQPKSLIDLSKVSLEDINLIIQNSFKYKKEEARKLPLFFSQRQRSFASLFLEASTRTKLSFELAGKKLGMHNLNFEVNNSSILKGESILDTAYCLKSMGVDFLVIRSKDTNLQMELVEKLNIPIISAGAGKEYHPTQCLLDLSFLRQIWQSFENKKILFLGDTKFSRVVSSHLQVLSRLNCSVYQYGPKEYLRDDLETSDLDRILEQVDLVYLLRAQKERHSQSNLNTELNYNLEFGLNKERLKRLNKSALIMHPGPFVRDMELTADVLEDSRCKIWDQVNFAVSTRMACFEWLVS